jgi:hypothetical protein
MGLTWITEIISWAVGGADYYWYITDIVNMLRAVFIFVIFCCKRSVLNLLRVRLASFLPCAKRMTHGKSGMSVSGPTSSLQLTTSMKKSTRGSSQDTWQFAVLSCWVFLLLESAMSCVCGNVECFSLVTPVTNVMAQSIVRHFQSLWRSAVPFPRWTNMAGYTYVCCYKKKWHHHEHSLGWSFFFVDWKK